MIEIYVVIKKFLPPLITKNVSDFADSIYIYVRVCSHIYISTDYTTAFRLLLPDK
jgi:hypothetical protein